MQELTKSEGVSILVTEETRVRVGDRLRFLPAGAVVLRGRTQAVHTYVPQDPSLT